MEFLSEKIVVNNDELSKLAAPGDPGCLGGGGRRIEFQPIPGSTVKHCMNKKQTKIQPSMLSHIIVPALGKLRHENCHILCHLVLHSEFLGYIVRLCLTSPCPTKSLDNYILESQGISTSTDYRSSTTFCFQEYLSKITVHQKSNPCQFLF